MFMLVSLTRVKQALHIEHTDDDLWLPVLISAASRAVVRHLGSQAGALLQIDSPPNSPTDDLDDVPEDIALAVIMLTGIMYRSTDQDIENAFADGELPNPVRAMLRLMRDPTMA
jgi:hypothetical protein